MAKGKFKKWIKRTKDFLNTLGVRAGKLKKLQHPDYVELIEDIERLREMVCEKNTCADDKEYITTEIEGILDTLEEYEKAEGIHYTSSFRKNSKQKDKGAIGFNANKKDEKAEDDTKEVIPKFRKIDTDDGNVLIEKGTPALTSKSGLEIVITKPVYERIMTYTRLLDVEITGLLTVDHIGEGTLKIDEIHMFNQKVSGSQADKKDAKSLCDMMDRMIKEGGDPSRLRGWWHSHNTMSTSPSTTDEETSKQYAGNKFLVTLITNHDGDIYSRVTLFNPVYLEIEKVPVYVEGLQVSKDVIDECKANIVKYVEEENFGSTAGYNKRAGYYGYGGYKGNQYPLVDTGHSAGVDPVEDEDEDPDAEWGEHFRENGIRYEWDRKEKRYRMFDLIMGREIAEDEIENMGAHDYNRDLRELREEENKDVPSDHLAN